MSDAESNKRFVTWCVSEEKVGTMSQCVGVARYVSQSEPVLKVVVPRHGIAKFFAPKLHARSDNPPEVIISCGYRPEKPVLRMKRTFRQVPLAVHLQRPEIDGYDLVFVSNHDWTPDLDGRPGYHRMIGVPHRLRLSDLNTRREAARRRFTPDSRPLTAVFVGGDNGAYTYDNNSITYIRDAISSLISQGARVVVSTSRRSSLETFDALMSLASPMVEVWDKKSPNPYLDYVAAADAFLIAKDSITMPCEALLTGKPVFTMALTQVEGTRLIKFERFHDDLRETLKLTREFSGSLEAYDYEPINEAQRVANCVASTLRNVPIS